MVNYYIYAKDFSCSTCGNHYYHENGLQTLKQFKSDIQNIQSKLLDVEDSRIIYLHWGHTCVEVDNRVTVEGYENLRGNGCDTLPETIIEWIRENIHGHGKIKLLYIVTDGLIDSSSLDNCMHLNKNIDYENVVFHGINENLDSIDLSVAVSFLKSNCKIYRNIEQIDDTNISEEFDYAKINISNFATEKEKLKSYIKLKYINSSNKNATALTEIENLKKLRNGLFSALSTRASPNLETKEKYTFLREFKNTSWYINLTNQSNNLKIHIDKSISSLINYIICDKKSYAFDALKFENTYSIEVPEEDIVDANFTTDQEIEFPDIILDDEKGIPVILFTELNLLKKIIFNTSNESSASFSKFKSTMECPLFLLDDPELNESIGYFYTLNVYKQLIEKTSKTEPRTRKPFHGGLILVDTDDFDRYNDYILSATYFNFKKVKYNIGLFYFVLWKICEKKQWMDRNVVEQFKKYMLRRISTTECKIGLSSLPLDPQVNCLLPAALWYCVELSSDIFKHDRCHFAHERLRMYHGVASSMIEILIYLEYHLDMNSINSRRDIIKHVMVLKKIPILRDKVYYLAERVFKKVNGFLICEIEHPMNVKKFNYLKLHHKEMLRDDVVNQKVNVEEYVYFLYHLEGADITICEKTFRPFFAIDQNQSFYSKLFEIAKKVVTDDSEGKIFIKYNAMDEIEFTRVLSLYKLFLECVQDGKKIPTLQEYMEYILKKRKFKDDLVTIFAVNVCTMIESVYRSYERVTKGVRANEVISLSRICVNRIERIKAEQKVIFRNDYEILEFLCEEEAKNLNWNLNKTQWIVGQSTEDKIKEKILNLFKINCKRPSVHKKKIQNTFTINTEGPSFSVQKNQFKFAQPQYFRRRNGCKNRSHKRQSLLSLYE